MRFLIVILLLLPTVAHGEMFRTGLQADFTGDGIPDRAELVQEGEEDAAGLLIFIGRADGSETQSVHAPALVWMGSGMMGQQPELTVTSHGSLQVISMNEAIGRDRWHEVLTIAYRQSIFKVAGYTYGWYDTLDLNRQGVCDINLLNGRGEMTLGADEVKTPFRTDLRAMPVADWPVEIPQVCLAALR